MSAVITKFANSLLVSFLLAVLFSSLAFADFNCTAQVSYGLTKKDEKKPTFVEHSAAEASAESEELAKQALERPVRELKMKAREACRELHENLSGCVGAKFETMASVLQRLPFSSRKSVEDAISQDCEAQMGTCGEVKSEISCAEHQHEGDKKAKPAEGDAGGGHGH